MAWKLANIAHSHKEKSLGWRRFKITANIVTMLRIILLPVPVCLVQINGPVSWWIAFVLFVILGATDFIDGLMARKEGPTKLGGLLDPVADKIFLGAITLSLTAAEYIPAWVLAGVVSREFILTALRSSVASRGAPIKTSLIAKIKTVIQMGGFGTIFLAVFTPSQYLFVTYTAFTLGFGFVWAVYLFRLKRKPAYWLIPVFSAFLSLSILSPIISQANLVYFQIVVILLITWGSGIDYFVSSYRAFAGSPMNKHDTVRLFWALVHSVLVTPLVGFYTILVLPILVSISLELALGGVDNVVASEEQYMGLFPYLTTGISGLLFAIIIYGNVFSFWSVNIILWSSMNAFVSLIVFSVTFRKWAHLFKGALKAT